MIRFFKIKSMDKCLLPFKWIVKAIARVTRISMMSQKMAQIILEIVKNLKAFSVMIIKRMKTEIEFILEKGCIF